MTERKPPGMRWETWIDRQIREGMERGEFDELSGHGKPLTDLDQPRDEMWWVRDKLRRESLSFLPPTLLLRKAVDEAKVAIAAAADEATVRRLVDEINGKIRETNRLAAAGPPTTLSPFDPDEVVANWRAAHHEADRVGDDQSDAAGS